MCYVRPCLADVSAHLPHDTDVVVAVEKVVLVLSPARAPTGAVGCLVRLQRCIAEDDDQPLCILITGGYGNVLLSDEPRQIWWRQ